ncbi:TIM barrel protein [Clostridium sp. PL3]|uniref:TIM barrel protein n=1 Tax=Clostridium thailandense TaxID=2794346 RepID=A0A949TWI4_9CLOT|nr:TIM barrel protein [Clostridium thailandense]MBV7274886.1 TIM barrel protein [Clostridium thailandense]
MDKLLFGISGIPIGDGSQKFNYSSGIKYLKSIGLDAMELPFVRSVNVTDKNKDLILKTKLENDFYLSAHGSYYINLNADEEDKQLQSIERIIKGANGISKVDGRSLIFHPGFYLKDSKEETYKTIKENLLKLPSNGVDYRLETTGKGTQFGSLEELVSLCKEIPTCKLCIDFSHIHARHNGKLKSYDDFAQILQYIQIELGKLALEDLHIHLSGINYSEKGERNHLPFLESDFNFVACLRALKDFNIKGCIICESPILEKDALLLKETYEKLSNI